MVRRGRLTLIQFICSTALPLCRRDELARRNAAAWMNCSTNRRCRPLSSRGEGHIESRPAGRPRRDQPADAAGAPGPTKSWTAGGRLHHFQSRPRANPRHIQTNWPGDRSVSAEPSGQGRERHGGVCRPSGDRPCPLRHLRGQQWQLCAAVRATTRLQMEVVFDRFQRSAGELRGFASRTSCRWRIIT